MPNPVQLLHTGGVPAQSPRIFYAEVSNNQPLPTSMTDPLYVVVPDWTTDFYYTITGWPALYGTAMPLAGDPCMVVRDNRDNLRVVWWGQLVPQALSTWIAPDLLNSWGNYGSGTDPAGYLRDALGFVHLRGRISGGANNTITFNLPPGYRPGYNRTFPIAAYSYTSVVAAIINISTGGDISASVAGGTVGWISLSEVSFLAEN